MQAVFRVRRRRLPPIDWQPAPDIGSRVDKIISALKLDWSLRDNIHCFRSVNANTRAYARIWGLGKIWQLALNQDPSYVIEVISEKFDHLPVNQQDKILIHELAHIPKTFSGSLLPHTRGRKGSFHDKLRTMEILYDKAKK